MKVVASMFWRYVRNVLWAIIVAYMLALHNIYYEEQKFENDITIAIEEDHEITDSAPRD